MKRFSYNIRKLRETDNKIIKFKEEMDVLITSDKFINEFKGYIEDIALYKTVKGRKYRRSTDYAAIGIMTVNDLIQEAYLAFLEAYSKVDFTKDGGEIWSYLKKTTILNLEIQLRGKKDGIRITQYEMFKDGSVNTNVLTGIFGKLEEMFSKNAEEVSLTKWESDLTCSFLDMHFDEYLDLKKNGKRNLKGIERFVMRNFYGLDGPRMSSKEIGSQFGISESTVGVIKKRAINKLKDEESKLRIANFLHEYRIVTKADTEKYRNNPVFFDGTVKIED